MGTKKKSFKKAITWMVIDNIVTFSVAYLFTRQIAISFGVAIISNTLEILLYWLHEEGWNRFGKV